MDPACSLEARDGFVCECSDVCAKEVYRCVFGENGGATVRKVVDDQDFSILLQQLENDRPTNEPATASDDRLHQDSSLATAGDWPKSGFRSILLTAQNIFISNPILYCAPLGGVSVRTQLCRQMMIASQMQ